MKTTIMILKNVSYLLHRVMEMEENGDFFFPPSGGPCAGSDYRKTNSSWVLPLAPCLELYTWLRTSDKLPLMTLTVVLPLTSAGNKSFLY